MLFQTANCILNYIGGVLKYFQCLGYQKISIWLEAQVWRSPRSEGVAVLLDGVTLVAPRATLEPGPGEAAAAHSLYMGVCASHKGEGEFKGQQRMTWELKEGKSRTKVGGGNRRERKRKKRGLFSYRGQGVKGQWHIAHCSSSHTLRLGRDPKPSQDQATALKTSESYL